MGSISTFGGVIKDLLQRNVQHCDAHAWSVLHTTGYLAISGGHVWGGARDIPCPLNHTAPDAGRMDAEEAASSSYKQGIQVSQI